MRIYRATLSCASGLALWLGCSLFFPPALTFQIVYGQTLTEARTLTEYHEMILPGPLTARSDVQAFIGEMVSRHGFSRHQLERWFRAIRVRDDIIAKISRPAEKTKTWHDYRAIFLDSERIANGAEFWREHQGWLTLAEQRYGVPAQIIIAILGVETRYGRVTGNDRVLEALSTLAFAYPPRSTFFRQELEHYLILTREEGIDPLTLTGSYAGAMGLAQFMPSSYRSYAVDFDGDGHRDLWHNPADAIGSIAHYLSRHRWIRNGPIATPAILRDPGYRQILSDDLKPRRTLAQLENYGIFPTSAVDPTQQAILLELEGNDNGTSTLEYWLGFDNFYVITRYNHSHLYAMAVYHLSREIRRLYGA